MAKDLILLEVCKNNLYISKNHMNRKILGCQKFVPYIMLSENWKGSSWYVSLASVEPC